MVSHQQTRDTSYQSPAVQQPSYQATSIQQQPSHTQLPPINTFATNPETGHLSMPESPLDRLRQERDASRARLAEIDRQKQEQERRWAEEDKITRETQKLARKAERIEAERLRKVQSRSNRPPPHESSTKKPKKSRSTYYPDFSKMLIFIREEKYRVVFRHKS
jgi:hypothetical protein